VRVPNSASLCGANSIATNEASRTLNSRDARLGQYLPPFLSDSGVVARQRLKKPLATYRITVIA
jgi:hypothetical protein